MLLFSPYFPFRESISVNTVWRKRYWNRTFAYPICWSVCRSVGWSVRKVNCGKMADWIRMHNDHGGPMATVIVEGKGYFAGEFGASHCNQWGLRCVVVREQRALPKLLWGTCFIFNGPTSHPVISKCTGRPSPNFCDS